MDYSGGLLLQYANLSDLAVCGSGLIDKICERFIGLRSEGPAPPVILTASSGPTALPWPAELENGSEDREPGYGAPYARLFHAVMWVCRVEILETPSLAAQRHCLWESSVTLGPMPRALRFI